MTTKRTSGLARLLALLAALGLLAAACSAADDDEGGTSAVDDEAQQEQIEEVEAGESAGEDIRGDAEDAGDPVRGGVLVYGIEAQVANPWAPFALTCSVSCATPLGAVADPLFDIDADGEVIPVLAEGIESNEDATVWTLSLRDGVMMHDGEPFDAEAVAYNINVCRASANRGQDFLLVSDVIVVDDLTVEFQLSQPWAAFPAAALDTPCGTHMMAPSWLRTLEQNPLRGESSFTGDTLIDQETVDTPADGDHAAPVSMGPFRFVDFTPGNGNGLTLERFEDYWRGDGPNSVTGEGLPYLDGIEFIVAEDINSRSAGVQSGEFDIIHTSNADEISTFRSDSDFVVIEANKFGETNYNIINQSDNAIEGLELDPDGVNSTSPLLDLRVRRALAHTLDRDRIAEERGAGIVDPANGPFAPGQPGFLEDNGYPELDIEAGQALLDEYVNDPERNDGNAVGDPISFRFRSTNDPFNVETNQLIVSMWDDAFGDLIDVELEVIEQGEYVNQVVVGSYEMANWRQHGGADHDTQLRFWISATAAPIGTPTFNFGRFHDPDLDALADASRATTDPDERREIFEDMNRLFGERVYILPTTWTLWAMIANPYVQDIAPLTTADGVDTFPVIAGAHSVTQIWCTGGSCE